MGTILFASPMTCPRNSPTESHDAVSSLLALPTVDAALCLTNDRTVESWNAHFAARTSPMWGMMSCANCSAVYQDTIRTPPPEKKNTHRDTEVDELRHGVVESLQLRDEVRFECHGVLREVLDSLRQFPTVRLLEAFRQRYV